MHVDNLSFVVVFNFDWQFFQLNVMRGQSVIVVFEEGNGIVEEGHSVDDGVHKVIVGFDSILE